MGSLGKYVLALLFACTVQFAVIMPIFLLARGLNPLKVFKTMNSAVAMGFFSKSSTAPLPIMLPAAENRLGVNPKVAKRVVPLLRVRYGGQGFAGANLSLHQTL